MENKSIRFDVAILNQERLKKFIERLEFTAFLIECGAPKGKTVFLDAQFSPGLDISAILKGFEDVKYIDYSHVPFSEWRYPFC